MTKKELRKHIKSQLLGYSAEQLASFSHTLCETLKNSSQIIDSDCIMAFYPLWDEIDIKPFISHALSCNKTILLPEVTDGENMQLRQLTPNAPMTLGALGTSVPEGEVFTNYNAIDSVIVPGVAFDKQGNRMGRGKGYYDRFLPLMENAYKIGVCFPFQLLQETMPHEEHDIKMDEVITG